MPSQPRTHLSKLCILSCLVTVALYCATVDGAFAASAASADQSTYAGSMLDKIIEIWAPPPALKSDFRVRLKVSVNSRGQVEDCKPLKSSGLEAFDNSVCGAVRQVGSFGTPPYGAPIDVHLTFWNGTPKGKPRPETLSSEEALRAEVKARSKAEAALGDTRAEAAEDRARERAEAIAKSGGKDVPEVRPAPVAPRAPQKADDNRKKPVTNNQRLTAGQNSDNGPATQIIGKSSQPAEPQNSGTRQAQQAAPQARRQADNLPSYGDPTLGGHSDVDTAAETHQAETANLFVRSLGFKPYLAPGLSSAAVSVLRALRGDWHDGAVPLGGAYFGCRAKLGVSGPEIRRERLHPELMQRITESYRKLEEFQTE